MKGLVCLAVGDGWVPGGLSQVLLDFHDSALNGECLYSNAMVDLGETCPGRHCPCWQQSVAVRARFQVLGHYSL